MLPLNSVHCADCLQKMGEIDDKSIDLTITSPPYDNLRDYNGYVFNFEGIAKELYRITKDSGVVVWIVGDATIKGSETGTSFRQALYFKEIGFNLHDAMIWDKPYIVPKPSNRYESAHEYMFVFSKGAPRTVNLIKDKPNIGAGRKITGNKKNVKGEPVVLHGATNGKTVAKFGTRHNIWRIDTRRGHTAYPHPAPFPEKLAEDHILSWSNEGDLVFDPMAGSGTTLKMAKKNNRNYIGIEISQEYIAIINTRLAS